MVSHIFFRTVTPWQRHLACNDPKSRYPKREMDMLAADTTEPQIQIKRQRRDSDGAYAVVRESNDNRTVEADLRYSPASPCFHDGASESPASRKRHREYDETGLHVPDNSFFNGYQYPHQFATTTPLGSYCTQLPSSLSPSTRDTVRQDEAHPHVGDSVEGGFPHHVTQGHPPHLHHPDYDQGLSHHQSAPHHSGPSLGVLPNNHQGAHLGPGHSPQLHQYVTSNGTPHPLAHSVDLSQGQLTHGAMGQPLQGHVRTLSGHDRSGMGPSSAYHGMGTGALDHQFGQRDVPNGVPDMRALDQTYDDDFELDGYAGANGEWVHRPSVEEKTLNELCEISHLHNNEKFQSLFVDYTEGVSFPLGEGGRELLRACLNAKGCKGRQLQGASVPQLLTLAHNWGMWNIALRIKIERATGGFCKHHKDFVQFKASQSQLRKYLKREQMTTDRDADGKITSIQFEEMKYLTLGKEGREKLRAQLRRMHDKDAQHMDRLLESHSFKYSELRNATVPSLLKMANICGMWNEVVQACRDQEAKREQRHSIKHPKNEYGVKSEYGAMQSRQASGPQVSQSQSLPPSAMPIGAADQQFNTDGCTDEAGNLCQMNPAGDPSLSPNGESYRSNVGIPNNYYPSFYRNMNLPNPLGQGHDQSLSSVGDPNADAYGTYQMYRPTNTGHHQQRILQATRGLDGSNTPSGDPNFVTSFPDDWRSSGLSV
eukprot:Selendium_serpulae@DN3933_c0_g1_i1.p1